MALNTAPEVLPWWQSRVILGTMLSALAKFLFALLALLNVDVSLTEQEVAPMIEYAILAISFIGDFVAGQARVTQKFAPPITR